MGCECTCLFSPLYHSLAEVPTSHMIPCLFVCSSSTISSLDLSVYSSPISTNQTCWKRPKPLLKEGNKRSHHPLEMMYHHITQQQLNKTYVAPTSSCHNQIHFKWWGLVKSQGTAIKQFIATLSSTCKYQTIHSHFVTGKREKKHYRLYRQYVLSYQFIHVIEFQEILRIIFLKRWL